jgi:TnpA family transposase
LGNTTELSIVEHAVDSHGQTLIAAALCDLVGVQLSPRIANLTAKPLWRPRPAAYYLDRWPNAGCLLANPAQTDTIGQHWDDLCRIAGSLKLGHVPASLLTAKLQARTRQHPLAKALLEHGKLLRTVHALRWFSDEIFRRRIGRQLNLGESVNDLRRHVWVAQRGNVHHRHHDDQTMQAQCHTLLVNSCVLSTTQYLQDAAEANRAADIDISDKVLARTSTASFEHISPWGTYNFDVAGIRKRDGRRPLRPLTTSTNDG